MDFSNAQKNKLILEAADRFTEKMPPSPTKDRAREKIIRQVGMLYNNNLNRGMDDDRAAREAIKQFVSIIKASKTTSRSDDVDKAVHTETIVANAREKAAPPPKFGDTFRQFSDTTQPQDTPDREETAESNTQHINPAVDYSKPTPPVPKPTRKPKINYNKIMTLINLGVFGIPMILLPILLWCFGTPGGYSIAIWVIKCFICPAICLASAVVITYCLAYRPIPWITAIIICTLHTFLFQGFKNGLWLIIDILLIISGILITSIIKNIIKTKRKEN